MSPASHRGDEPYAGAEVVNHVAGMQSLGQLAPVGLRTPQQIAESAAFLVRRRLHGGDRASRAWELRAVVPRTVEPETCLARVRLHDRA